MEGDHLTQIQSNAVLIEKGLVEKGAYTVLGGTAGQLLLLNLHSLFPVCQVLQKLMQLHSVLTDLLMRLDRHGCNFPSSPPFSNR
jgi:hypothetical protein